MEGSDQPSESRKFTLGREERIKSKKSIGELFEKGSSFFIYPFKVFYLKQIPERTVKHQILVSVSKKLHKKAVDRNLIKRRIKEAYRLNKHLIADQDNNQPLLIGLIFVGKFILPFNEIESKLKLVLLRLNEVRLK